MTLQSFEDLNVYKKAKELRQFIAAICRQLPVSEQWRLIDQMLRASRSITNQIAEGYGRFHFQENVQFCRIARGSLEELHDHMSICFEENYISEDDYNKFLSAKSEVRKLLNGYISFLKKRAAN